jgi:hypothetical protein
MSNIDNSIDTKYVLLLEKLFSREIIFQGLFGKTIIEYQRLSKVWFLNFINSGSNISQRIANFNSSSEFPLGKLSWNFMLGSSTKQDFLKFSQVKNSFLLLLEII